MIIRIIILIGVIIFMSSCSSNKTIIAISKTSSSSNYENYKNAILHYDNNIDVVDLWSIPYDSAMKVIEGIDGLVLSGGPDVAPSVYGRGEDSSLCSIDTNRDKLEFSLINYALEQQIPILGICRGLQILNVALGGSLIVDIPREVANHDNHQVKEGDAYHNIKIIDGSLLNKLTNLKECTVNSNHHQSIDKLAKGLKATAYSGDGVIEAIEYEDINKPYMMAVQWHPERMDLDDTLSMSIFTDFIKHCKLKKK
ncbi:MAG TPA: gamma-glutamyl-gamma-aminobutyrate hydrolase family protein [Candidatus Kapabacteria bacterium]|nr:gamma-glutamyl-gamma-aminobutyrate hydrolase family protein [Candidatus Kapabacteria bacterium]